MSFLFGNRNSGKRIPPNATFRLTQEGREKLQEFGGDPESRVLVALETRGSCNIRELSHESGVGVGKLERLLPEMISGGRIQYVSPNSGGEE